MAGVDTLHLRDWENGKEEWLTPPWVLEALGDFDLDPCAPCVRPWSMARRHFDINDDGLAQVWSGRVWCNPPYNDEITHLWMRKMSYHNNGIALLFARTETKAFWPWVWHRSDAVFFFRRRLTFYHVDGTCAKWSGGAPSVLIAYGAANVDAIARSGLAGKLVQLR